MTQHAQQILEHALTLSAEERAELAERVLESLDAPQRKRIDQEWAAEADDRVRAVERGELPTIPAEDVYREYRERRLK